VCVCVRGAEFIAGCQSRKIFTHSSQINSRRGGRGG
jgi:hypothetical protein